METTMSPSIKRLKQYDTMDKMSSGNADVPLSQDTRQTPRIFGIQIINLKTYIHLWVLFDYIFWISMTLNNTM